VSDVNDVIETAIGGKARDRDLRGRAALPGAVRCPSASATTSSRSPTSCHLADGAQVPLPSRQHPGRRRSGADLARTRQAAHRRRRQRQGRDLGSFVAELQQIVDAAR
jgi:Cu/Ag efflux pump CusA